MKKTLSQHAHEYLKKHKGWQWGGTVEDALRIKTGSKASTIRRRLQELSQENLINHRYEFINSRYCVQYKAK